MSGVRIVSLAPAKAPAFHALLDEVARERRHLALLEAPPLDSILEFTRDVARCGFVQLAALDDERLVGWCDIRRKGAEVFAHVGVLGMGVAASHRGRGIGRRLLLAALERAIPAGAERVELEVFASNAAALALYASVGFAEEGRRSRACRIDGRAEDIVLMAKLTAPSGAPVGVGGAV